MTVRRRLWLTVLGIVVLTVLAGIVDYPKGPNITWPFERELKVHLGLDLQGGTSLVYEADTAQLVAGEEAEALAGVRDVIERRINAFGVSEPVVQTNKVGNNWRVIVELPGVTDINAAVKQIGETPLLEFKVEDDNQAVTDEQKQLIDSLNQQTKTQAEGILLEAKAGGDFVALASANSQDIATKDKAGDVGYANKANVPTALVEALYTTPVGEVAPNLIETDDAYYIVKITKRVHTAQTVDELNRQIDNGEEPSFENDLISVTSPDEEVVRYSQITFRKLTATAGLFGPNYTVTELTGKNLKSAEVQFTTTTNEPVVTLNFDEEGSKLFADITRDNVGKTVAIFLDGSPISTPLVNEAITSGSAQISGSFTIEEAKELKQRLNAGALPIKITLVNQRNIGPTLGQDAIERSVTAGLIGVLLLAIFMVAYYRWPGFVAIIALGVYSLLLLAIFKLWPITLTLAGVAGFIFSLGVAVDANVLIFERLKEELRSGKSLQTAVDDGFKRAWLSIRDSNMSSLITCFILSWLGTSVIKGFAITLALGIVVSLFTAITVTRTLLKFLPVNNPVWYGIKRK